jgi:hypothetical protein
MVRWFIQALARYTTIDEFKAAQNYLKSTDNDQIIAFYDKINLANDRFGNGGADIVFDQDGILVIEVKSFPSNQLLNTHSHIVLRIVCINGKVMYQVIIINNTIFITLIYHNMIIVQLLVLLNLDRGKSCT